MKLALLSQRSTNPWLALALRMALIAVCAGALTLLLPGFAFAQEGNPFADAGARSWAIEGLKSLRFWVWIGFGLGVCIFLLAYALQGIVPSFYQQTRDFLRTGLLLMFGFGVGFQFIITMANK